MQLSFLGGNETAILDLDRKKKILYVTSTKTNGIKTKTEWKNLFDKGKEAEQEKITDNISDKLFIAVVIKFMAQAGYRLLGKK